MNLIMYPFMLLCVVALIFIVYIVLKIASPINIKGVINMSKLFAGIIYVLGLVSTCIFMGEMTGDNTLAYFTGCYMVSAIGLLLLLVLYKAVDIYEKNN